MQITSRTFHLENGNILIQAERSSSRNMGISISNVREERTRQVVAVLRMSRLTFQACARGSESLFGTIIRVATFIEDLDGDQHLGPYAGVV